MYVDLKLTLSCCTLLNLIGSPFVFLHSLSLIAKPWIVLSILPNPKPATFFGKQIIFHVFALHKCCLSLHNLTNTYVSLHECLLQRSYGSIKGNAIAADLTTVILLAWVSTSAVQPLNSLFNFHFNLLYFL